jgi:hypothetical protein
MKLVIKLLSCEMRHGAANFLLKWVHTVTLPRTVTPSRGGVDAARDNVTYQKLVKRYLYGHVR